MPEVREHFTPRLYVDEAIYYWVDESPLLRLDRDEKLNLDEKGSIILNSSLRSPKTILEIPTKSYVDNLQEISRKGRDLSSVYIDQDNEFDRKNLNNLCSVTVNRNPSSDNEVSFKKYVDYSIGEGTIVRFNQTLENYLKVSVGIDTYNLTKGDKIQITDTTETKFPNIGSDSLQKWNINCNNKINDSKVGKFIKSTITNSPTGHSGATSLPPIGDKFMYMETSSKVHGQKRVCVRIEWTDFIKISIITLFFKRFSILNNEAKKSMGRFRNQLLLGDNTWSTQCTIPKSNQYSNTSTD